MRFIWKAIPKEQGHSQYKVLSSRQLLPCRRYPRDFVPGYSRCARYCLVVQLSCCSVVWLFGCLVVQLCALLIHSTKQPDNQTTKQQDLPEPWHLISEGEKGIAGHSVICSHLVARGIGRKFSCTLLVSVFLHLILTCIIFIDIRRGIRV